MIANRTRGELAAAASGALVALIGLAAALLVGHGWWSGSGGSYAPRRAIVSTQVTPHAVALRRAPDGARARSGRPALVVDVKHVALRTNFKPYGVRDESRQVRDGPGRATIVEFSYVLQCTSRPCLPRGGGRPAAAEIVQLRPAALTLPQRGRRERRRGRSRGRRRPFSLG